MFFFACDDLPNLTVPKLFWLAFPSLEVVDPFSLNCWWLSNTNSDVKTTLGHRSTEDDKDSHPTTSLLISHKTKNNKT